MSDEDATEQVRDAMWDALQVIKLYGEGAGGSQSALLNYVAQVEEDRGSEQLLMGLIAQSSFVVDAYVEARGISREDFFAERMTSYLEDQFHEDDPGT